MNKKQLVSTGIILALLGSNIIIGNQYIQDSKEYQKEIRIKSEIIKRKQAEIKKNLHDSTELDKENQDKIHVLTDELNKAKNDLNQMQQDKENLSNQLKITPSRGEQSHPKAYYEVTAYTSGYESTGKTPGDPDYQVTASGTKVREGRTIACPPSLPFGTKVNIETVGLRICEDHGGAIKSGKIDLYVESLSKAIEFGKRTLMVEILN